MSNNSLEYFNKIPREIIRENISTLSPEALKEYYLSGDYESYFIEYVGDISKQLSKIDYAYVYNTGKFFAILFVKKGMLNTLLENVPEIIGVQQNFPYTLSGLEMNTNTANYNIVDKDNIPLDGTGVIVGIISTGIDYLNPRFTTPTGESRIVAIWDQTLNVGPNPKTFPYGTVFNKLEINEAIRANALGKSSYEIVNHKDEVGDGTAIAGIIGGRSLAEDDFFKTVAPKCEFAIVKLTEAVDVTLESLGIEKGTKNVYQSTNISSAIRYLSDLQVDLKKPMVVYFALGSNVGGRDGDTVLERYIDNLTQRSNFSVVTNTGDQGEGTTHTSGILGATGATKDILINIDKGQNSLNISIYTSILDTISLTITSPLGASISKISFPPIEQQNKYLTFKEDDLIVQYFGESRPTGTVIVNILIKNTVEGIWKVSLFGELIISGKYNAWLLQSELLRGNTRFLEPVSNTTLLTPSSSVNILVTSYYDQIKNIAPPESGKGFPTNGRIEPSLSTEGIDMLTVGLNNSLTVASGAAISGAILASAVALIYQWGIVQGNYLEFYPPRLKNLLIASTIKDDDKIYPNIEWGYGKLSLNKLYSILKAQSKRFAISDNFSYLEKNQSTDRLYINIPEDIYNSLK